MPSEQKAIGQFEPPAIMGEKLDDDHAVAETIRAGLFKSISCSQFNCSRIMTLKDFQDWQADFANDRAAPQERLVQTVHLAYKSKGKGKRITVKGSLVLKALKKVEA